MLNDAAEFMRIICSNHKDTAWNLAAEEVLFKGRDSALLLYINPPSVVIGCNQFMESELDRAYCQKNNIGVYRRISGGGAVYHDGGNINYCFVQDKNPQLSSLNGAFLEPVEHILQSLGLQVSRARRKDLWSGGYKISGTASHIAKGRELHHGTLLYDSNLEALHAALGLVPDNKAEQAPKKKQVPGSKGIASVPSPVANIRSLYPSLANLSAQEFLNKFLEAAVRYYSQTVRKTEEQDINDLQKMKLQDLKNDQKFILQGFNEEQKREQEDLQLLQGFREEELIDIAALSRQKYQSKAWNEMK